MKDIIDFLETNVNGKTLHTKELVYELESGTLEGVYSAQIFFRLKVFDKRFPVGYIYCEKWAARNVSERF